MRTLLVTFALIVLAAGCRTRVGSGSNAGSATVVMQRPVPWADGSDIAGNIKRECRINEQLADFTQEFAAERGIKVDFAPAADEKSRGRALEVQIQDAVSQGNAFIGHQKSITVHGRLLENGTVIGTFKGRRTSMGGAFPGFKGSCAVLGRTARAVGHDIAEWLASPSMDASLGELK